jgi:prepilin peptidase CpaA
MDRLTFFLVLALMLAVTAAVWDVRQHRIPNWLTLPGIVAGMVLRSALLGWKGLGSAVAGCLLAGGVLLLFYMIRAMGAGDVKLMAAIGSLVGPSQAITIVLATAICGGAIGIAYALYRGRMWSTIKNVGSILKFHALAGVQPHPNFNLDNPEVLRVPYGLAIALGTFYVFVVAWWR